MTSSTAAFGFSAPLATLVGLFVYGVEHGSPFPVHERSLGLLILGAVLGAVFLVYGLVKLPWHRRLLAVTKELEGRSFVSGPTGFVRAVSGTLDGVRCRISRRGVWLDFPCRRVATLSRRDLVEVAHGPLVGVRPALVAFASMTRGRRAAAWLLERGVRRVELEPDGVRVVGARPAELFAAARDALTLARSPAFRMTQTHGTSVCPFCKGATIWRELDGIFRCPACDSLHHGPCWREHGGCSIYGCPRSPDRRERLTAPAIGEPPDAPARTPESAAEKTAI